MQIRSYVTVDDCGRVISPLLVDGQVHGGLAQGIGQALWEAIEYDDDGQLITGSLMDYAIPRAQDFPMFELSRTETPLPAEPAGGEGDRRAGDDRLDPGDRQRRRGCPQPVRYPPPRHAPATATDLAGDRGDEIRERGRRLNRPRPPSPPRGRRYSRRRPRGFFAERERDGWPLRRCHQRQPPLRRDRRGVVRARVSARGIRPYRRRYAARADTTTLDFFALM